MVAQAGTGSSMLPCWYSIYDDPQMIHPRRLMVCRKAAYVSKYTQENRHRRLLAVAREVRKGGADPRSLSQLLRPWCFVRYNNT